ncbi:MAG: hypothetical protein GQ565_03455 [Candidatus Aegiribacteria sp.]|nr:hypothetical protein [Candidatus Aegiribacteria sp.]
MNRSDKKSHRIHRIFLGIGEVAGYYTNLKKGFDELGIKSYFFSIDGHPFSYGNDNKKKNPYMRLMTLFLSRKISAKKRKSLCELWWTLLLVMILFPLRLALLIWSLFWCDVFVFHGTSSFFHGTSSFFEMYDLPILKLFGKRIIWVFHGSDTRPAYISGSSVSKDYGCLIEKCARIAKMQKKWVRRIEHYADVIISHPPSSHFSEKKFVRYLTIGNPFSCSYNKNTDDNIVEANKIMRIVHAPSFSEFKGSGVFRDIIGRMKNKGYSLEFIEIVGKPNSEVLKELADCDFVIDQLYSDTVMAGLATEAAFLGKPAVVGGYASIEDMGILHGAPVPPTEYHNPDEIETAIEKLITNHEHRVKLGENAKDFVLKQWAPAKVAERFLRVINDDYPEEWLYDPKDIRYLHGCGISEHNVKALLTQFVRHAGKEGLCLSDKPELEDKIIEFSYSDASE